ncbi:MAG: response regulator transcription factor [Bacteroidetes bacterium]|nr:response regulator transcription factor [Bacteroidota bacterium]MDA0874699.1 response regulator transcription factor [Bacteroidota bacterium]
MSILIVEDNEPQRTMLELYFREKEEDVIVASNAGEAIEQVSEHAPNIILMDWMLPDGSGIELTKQLRLNGFGGWIVMLTARSDVGSTIEGLQAGADDYLTKPFRIGELQARLGTATRRMAELKASQWYAGTVRIGDLVLEREYMRAYHESGDLILLTPLEFAVLQRLVMRHPEVTTRVELRGEAWGSTYAGTYNPLYAVVHRLKTKLRDAGVKRVQIKAAYKKGYRLQVS